MAKKSSKIKVSVIEPFLADLRKALQKPGLDEAHAVMDQYGIGFATKYTKNRYVVEQIIGSVSLPDPKKIKEIPLEVSNRLALIQEFLENGSDATELDDFGGNMFDAATYSLAPQCFKLLLDHGADPNVINKLGDNAISMIWKELYKESDYIESSKYQASLAILEMLLRSGANPWNQMRAWHCKNQILAYKIMSLANPGCVQLRQKANHILYDLFLNNPDLSRPDDPKSKEPLKFKSEIDDLNAVRAVYSIRPLVLKGNLDDAIDVLRQHFEIDYTTTLTNDGQYFLSLLIGEMNELLTPDKNEQHDHYLTLITRFLDNGLDVNHLNKDGELPLLTIAAFNREPELCKILLKCGADLNFKPSRGDTAIDAAIKSYRYDIAQDVKFDECVSLFLKEKVVINDPIKLVSHTSDGVTRILDTDPASQGLIKMFRKYGYLPKEEDEKAGK